MSQTTPPAVQSEISGLGLCRYQKRSTGGCPVRRCAQSSGGSSAARAWRKYSPSAHNPVAESAGDASKPRREIRSRARSSRTSGDFSTGTMLTREKGDNRRGARRTARRDDGQGGPGRLRGESLRLPCRRHELRGRGDPRGDGGLQRVLAPEHGRDRERRRRTPGGILLQAGQDRALDRRGEVRHDRRGVDRALVAVLAGELRQLLPGERPAPGEQLVQEQARGSRCRCGR